MPLHCSLVSTRLTGRLTGQNACVDVLELSVAVDVVTTVISLALSLPALSQFEQQLADTARADLMPHLARRRRQLGTALRPQSSGRIGSPAMAALPAPSDRAPTYCAQDPWPEKPPQARHIRQPVLPPHQTAGAPRSSKSLQSGILSMLRLSSPRYTAHRHPRESPSAKPDSFIPAENPRLQLSTLNRHAQPGRTPFAQLPRAGLLDKIRRNWSGSGR